MARLQEFYKEKVVADLTSKFGYKSVMEVPRLTKITLNMGVGEAIADKKVLEHAVGDLTKIAGQKPVTTKSRKAIAGFKIREGYPIGTMVTLRGARMYEFPTASSPWRCRACAISVASMAAPSMAVATTTSASKSRSSSRKSSTTRSMRCVV